MNDTKYQVLCGFFDSINKDRSYSANQMNRPYKRIISNGVFATAKGTPSTDLQVLSNNGMSVIVKAGEGLFGDKWFENPSDLTVTVVSNTDVLNRIDSIIVQVDNTQAGRVGNIVYRKGTPASNPQVPVINTEDNIVEYRVANILVEPSTTIITQDLITDLRGSSECPWITSLIYQVDTSTLYNQYREAYQKYYDDETDAFNAFMENLTEELTVNTNIAKYESHYTTSIDEENTIPINISTYNKDKDVLLVKINNLFASETLDYSISDDSSSIILTKSLKANQKVDFLVLQSVVVGDTATVLQKLATLQNVINVTKITSDDGGVKINVTSGSVLTAFKNAGIGFHTINVSSSAITDTPISAKYKLFGQMIDVANGWLIAIKEDGSIYENTLVNDVWKGWNTIYEVTPEALYFSEAGVFPNNDAEITPAKKLSECAHGWQLVFCKYSDTTSTYLDEYVQTINISKLSHKNENWNGENVVFQFAYDYNSTSDEISSCIKSFDIYDDKIVSADLNATGVPRNIVLKAIYEY